MSIVDERILEYLDEHELGSPSEIHQAASMDYVNGYFSERIRELAEHGLVQQVSPRGVYRITDRGEQYLAGDYDARDNNESPDEPEETETDGGTTTATA